MDISSVMGQAMSAYGQGVKPNGQQQAAPQPVQQQPLQKAQAPGMAPQMAGAPQLGMQQQQVTPQQVFQPQEWGINIGTGEPNRGISEMRGLAAGNAARQSSLAASIQNFQKAQGLSAQAQAQSAQAQGPQRQPQPNLAELMRSVQADTAKESAQSNPNALWASKQPVNPANQGDMDAAENYVNQNASTPPSLLDSVNTMKKDQLSPEVLAATGQGNSGGWFSG